MIMITKDKIRGLFLGIVIGDSLGLPCEKWSPQKIKETYGRITDYQSTPACYSDDTVLSLAVAQAFIDADGDFDLDAHAKCHIDAYKASTFGWGTTTKLAVQNLINGLSWRESGIITHDKKVLGMGNGVAMKAGPLGFWLESNKKEHFYPGIIKMANFTAMTHRTSMAISSCFAHAYAIQACLNDFSVDKFITAISRGSQLGESFLPETLGDNLTLRLSTLKEIKSDTSDEEIFEKYITSSYFYVYNSSPFTYAFFVRNPNSIESLYDCCSGGGDCDSNGSMLGSLLGALHGESFFPKHLVDGLMHKDEILAIADKFAESLGVMA